MPIARPFPGLPVEQISNIGIIVMLFCTSKGGLAAVRSGPGVVVMTRAMMIAVLGLAVPIGVVSGEVHAQPPAPAREEQFEAIIRPVLVQTCFPCHGGKKTGGGLRVGTRDELIRGGESGPAVVPNQPEQSLLIRAIGYGDDELKMPPGKKLPDTTIAALTRWVAEGAHWPVPARPERNEAADAPQEALGVRARQARSAAARSNRVVGPPDRSIHRGGTQDRRYPPRCRRRPANAHQTREL